MKKIKNALSWGWNIVPPLVVILILIFYLTEVGFNLISMILITIALICLNGTFNRTRVWVRNMRFESFEGTEYQYTLSQNLFGLRIPLTIFFCLIAFLFYAVMKELSSDAVLIVVGLCLFLIGIFMMFRARRLMLLHRSLDKVGFIVPVVIGLFFFSFAILSFYLNFVPYLVREDSFVLPAVITLLSLFIAIGIILPAYIKLKKEEREDQTAEES